ncbi:MAG: hypothetical protein IJ838_00400 [Paludibacteraceae bacterium]|nr:hypothetical protein [Paludibacteraceae bacterium]
MLLPACSVEHNLTSTDNRQQLSNHFHRDSIYLHDSTAVVYKASPTSAPCRVDTLLVHEWHTRWREKEVIRTDTVQVESTRIETVPVRYVPPFYKYCTVFAVLVLIALLLRFVWWLYIHFL